MHDGERFYRKVSVIFGYNPGQFSVMRKFGRDLWFGRVYNTVKGTLN